MTVASERVYLLQKGKSEKAGPVMYWMNRDMRLEDNWALLFACEKARELKQPLVIVYNLVIGFEKGIGRQYWFKIEALKEIEKKCKDISVPFSLAVDETGTKTPELILKEIDTHSVSVLVTDFSPLSITKKWYVHILKSFEGDVYEVDAHNIIPARFISQKREYGAYTLRPKVYKNLPHFLTKYPHLDLKEIPAHKDHKHVPIDWKSILELVPEDKVWVGKTLWEPGSHGALKALHRFLDKGLLDYSNKRNDPSLDGQSDLSPYLHFGHISAQRIVLEVLQKTGFSIDMVIDERRNGAKTLQGLQSLRESVSAFIEELVVRRELGDNFCLYTEDYSNPKCMPSWAELTLAAHKSDTREYIYTLKEFEQALTHDDAWNACQREMVYTGKMHGYMRMYWAKKILEWTPDIKLAFSYAVYLNDKYELDGREPSGYAGIAWALGGVHDRAWFERPIFGQIRYMNREGLKRKFDLGLYISKHDYGHSEKQKPLL